jgi:DNA (cytosine-5)-methyltransferase 1
MRSWHEYQCLLDELGKEYSVNPQVLDASDFGVPQKRRRLFVVCDSHAEAPKINPPKNAKRKTVMDILKPSEFYSAGPLYSDKRAAATIERAERAIKALGEGQPFLIVYYGSDGGGGWQSLDRPLRTMTTLDRFGLVEWNKSEPTLRMLQVPELQRAMGFDNSYKLVHGTRRDKIKLLGNGVCPPVMKSIVHQLISSQFNTTEAEFQSAVAAE